MARWFAILLAITFALGTVFLGVGSKTGNIFSGLFGSSGSKINASSSFEDREKFFQEQIELNQLDTDSMRQLATLYADESIGRYDDAILWLNKSLEIDPKNNDVRLLIARIQMDKKQDYAGAVKVLNEATAQDPSNALAFLLLGQAAKSSGQNQTAILAWNRYLELAPTSEYAQLLKDEIAQLSTQPAVAPQTSPIPGAAGTP